MIYLTTLAIIAVSMGFWIQVYSIHKHKEVRDLSVIQYISLAIGYFILSYVAYHDQSWVFFIKQLVSIFPVLVIIGQIIVHREDSWQD